MGPGSEFHPSLNTSYLPGLRREVHFEVTDCEDPQSLIRDQMKLVEKMQKHKAR